MTFLVFGNCPLPRGVSASSNDAEAGGMLDRPGGYAVFPYTSCLASDYTPYLTLMTYLFISMAPFPRRQVSDLPDIRSMVRVLKAHIGRLCFALSKKELGEGCGQRKHTNTTTYLRESLHIPSPKYHYQTPMKHVQPDQGDPHVTNNRRVAGGDAIPTGPITPSPRLSGMGPRRPTLLLSTSSYPSGLSTPSAASSCVYSPRRDELVTPLVGLSISPSHIPLDTSYCRGLSHSFPPRQLLHLISIPCRPRFKINGMG